MLHKKKKKGLLAHLLRNSNLDVRLESTWAGCWKNNFSRIFHSGLLPTFTVLDIYRISRLTWTFCTPTFEVDALAILSVVALLEDAAWLVDAEAVPNLSTKFILPFVAPEIDPSLIGAPTQKQQTHIYTFAPAVSKISWNFGTSWQRRWLKNDILTPRI